MCISTLVYCMPPHAICKPLKCDGKAAATVPRWFVVLYARTPGRAASAVPLRVRRGAITIATLDGQ